MTLTLYNTLSRKKQKFIPINPDVVKLYTCGPTVYNYMHIGNLRSFLFEDILKRTLMFNGYHIEHIMNITDVGHLTGENDDSGEDKMLKGAKREGKTVWEIAEFYTEAFKNDYHQMNLIPPKIWCKATDHIKEQIDMIKRLQKNGYTYSAQGNIYFNTSKLKDYGKLAKLNLNAETKARVEQDQFKKNPHDFVLWFTKSKFDGHEMKWDSPWGTGYPGWHIECSAMATKYLGEQFDIHCGGIDHIPIHHTNEIAQTEAATKKKPWVKYWLHNEFLIIASGEKMAKSGENFLTLKTLGTKNIHPLDYRYFCLGTHYKNPLMFNWDAVEGAKSARRRLNEKILEFKEQIHTPSSPKIIKEHLTKQKSYLGKFQKAINDDLNTPIALALVHEILKDEKLSSTDKLTLLYKYDEVLGLNLKDIQKDQIPQTIIALANERLQARITKDWKKSDELRQKIDQLGYIVGDTKEGFEIKKK